MEWRREEVFAWTGEDGDESLRWWLGMVMKFAVMGDL